MPALLKTSADQRRVVTSSSKVPEASATSTAGFAGQAESHIIFGQHHVPDPGPVFRLDLAYPEQFGEREIRQRRIAGQTDQDVAAKQF